MEAQTPDSPPHKEESLKRTQEAQIAQTKEAPPKTNLQRWLDSLELPTQQDEGRFRQMREERVRKFNVDWTNATRDRANYREMLKAEEGTAEDISELLNRLDGPFEEVIRIIRLKENQFLVKELPALVEQMIQSGEMPERIADIKWDHGRGYPIRTRDFGYREALEIVSAFQKAIAEGNMIAIAAGLQATEVGFSFDRDERATRERRASNHFSAESFTEIDRNILERARKQETLYQTVNQILQKRLGISSQELWQAKWSEILGIQSSPTTPSPGAESSSS